MNCFLSDVIKKKEAPLLNKSSEFLPIWQPQSSQDALSGFPRCIVARHQAFISTHQLTVSLKLSGPSPDGTSKREKETTQSRTVDLAASSKSCCLKLGLVALCLCASSSTVQASQAVSRIEFRQLGNLVKDGC